MPRKPPIDTAANLIPGQVYRVKAAFTDYDSITHPVGETWRFVSKNFLPYEDGLSLMVEQNGQRQMIRLQWRPEAQEHIIEGFARYVEAVGSAPISPAVHSYRRRPWWAIVIIGALIVAGIVCLVAVGGLAYFLDALTYRPSTINVDVTGIAVEIDAPISVSVGQDFNLTVTVRNSNDQSVLLDSLVIDGKTMDAVKVQGSDPAFTQVTPFKQNGDFLRYDFQHLIPAEGSLGVQFALNAQESGTYQGQVWVCTKTAKNCTVHPWTLIVK